MSLKRTVGLALVALLCVAVLGGCSGEEAPTSGDAATAKSQDNANATPSQSRTQAGKDAGPGTAQVMDPPK